jgi:hypothetical protein
VTSGNGKPEGRPSGAPPLPTVDELRGILLALNLDPNETAGDDLPVERQQSRLAALAATLLLAQLNNHLAVVDRMTADERYDLSVGPLVMMTDGDGISCLAFADLLLQWAGHLLGEVTSNDPDGTASPRLAMIEAIAAVLTLIEGYALAMGRPGFVIDDKVWHVSNAGELVNAAQHLMAAVQAICRLAGIGIADLLEPGE